LSLLRLRSKVIVSKLESKTIQRYSCCVLSRRTY
jgi:hypothetical protein